MESILPTSQPTLLLLTVFTAFYAYCYVIRRRGKDVHRLPTAPRGIAHWLWGHELLAFEGEATEMYTKWAALCGPVFKIKAALFHPDVVVVTDHAAVQHIFQNTDDMSPAFRPPVANVLGKGVVWAEGDDHKKQRHVLAPAFAPEAIKGMADDISECSEKLESRLTNQILVHGGAATVNIVEHTSTCTLDIIGRVAFGHDFHAGRSTEAQQIRASWESHVNSGITFGAFIAMLVIRACPSAGGRIREIVTQLSMRLVQRGAFSERGRDILSILMTGRQEGVKADALTPQQIVDNINTFLMVGHETTAGSLNFTLLELARRPDVQQRLRDEVRGAGRDLSYDDIQHLGFLDAVVKEGLRLHPASPQTERVVLKDDVIPLAKPVHTLDGRTLTSLRVKAGQVFHIPFTTMHVNPSVWGQNAAEFVPERWTVPGGVPAPSDLPHGWSGLVTFCDGPRNCIGYRLAIFEFKVILATLIRSLEFRETTAEVHARISPTLQPVTDGRGGLLPLYVSLAV
ncbi:cytochrome P450 [Fomitopsis serialis]|uniref:cytochrome P450 n=1 Tax=Fomitopsis serialis TaxID=139415 RepID=UPI002007EAD2|nr:cytochrome P450 [Neoantrodia serialis]KAH9919840.1 cytochrome P450 [Neoantrodia serialis]